MWKFLILAYVIAQASPLAADTALDRPSFCKLVATVQDDHCAVSNHFSCTGAGPVAFWKEVSHGNGALEVHSIDANYGTIEIVMPGGPHIKSTSSGDHPRAALETGSARKDERATLEQGNSSQPATMVTAIAYKGEKRELAGEAFYRLTYSSDLDFPEMDATLHTSGSLLFNERLGLLLLETDKSDGQGGPGRIIKLKSVALEGQKGFGSTKARYGCN